MDWFQKIIQYYYQVFISPDEQADTEGWYRARMISILCLTIITILIAFYMLRYYFIFDHPLRVTHLITGFIASLMMLYALRLNYYQRYDRAVLVIIGAGSSLVCVAAWFNRYSVDVIPLYYFVPMLLFSTPILSAQRTRLLIVGHMVALVLFGIMMGDPVQVLEGPGIFYFFTGLGVLTLSDYRARREALRVETLEVSEQRYRMISEMISDYAFAYRVDEDRNLHGDWITESVQSVTGYTPDELNAAWQRPILFSDNERNRVQQHVKEAIDGMTAQYEYEIVTKIGERRIVRINRRPIWDDEHRRVVRIYGVCQDITLEKAAEAEKATLAMERGRLSLINDFVSAISHDFRTRLANVETSRYLIQKDVRYLTEQLVNLNLISHLMELKLQSCDINQMIKGILDSEIHRAARKNIILRFEPASDLPAIVLDKAEFHRALVYLLTNAINYTDAGGKVWLRTSCEADMVCIRIVDTGQGIEPQHLSHIFDLFYRADPARSLQTGGVGLGLSLAKMIIEAHQGSITVESEPGEGSTFTVSLPLKMT